MTHEDFKKDFDVLERVPFHRHEDFINAFSGFVLR